MHGLLGGVFYTWRQRDKSKSALRLMGKQEEEKGKGRRLILSLKNLKTCESREKLRPMYMISKKIVLLS